jgi:hypothetical protein
VGNNGIGRRLATMASTAVVAAGMAAVAVSPGAAATISVGCGPDGVAELVGAVTTANASAGSDSINLTAGSTYTFAAPDNYWCGPNALPAIASTIVIEGNGAIIERSSAADTVPFRLFFVGAHPTRPETLDYTSPGAGDLTLRNLTVGNGLARGGNGGGGGRGGGIRAASSTRAGRRCPPTP